MGNETHWALACSGLGRKGWVTAYVGLRTTQHAVISGEMGVKHSSGQGGSVPSGSWGFLGHVHLPVLLPGCSLRLICSWAFQPGLLLCVFTCLERLSQGEQQECRPWILSGDIHPALCVVSITGATAGCDHPWLSQLFEMTNEIISWQISAASFGPAWHQFLCGVVMDFRSCA